MGRKPGTVGAMPPQRYLTPEQLVARWEGAVVAGTLANWRHKRNKDPAHPVGPAFQKLGSKVRYRVEDVEAYERANFTGQPAKPQEKA